MNAQTNVKNTGSITLNNKYEEKLARLLTETPNSEKEKKKRNLIIKTLDLDHKASKITNTDTELKLSFKLKHRKNDIQRKFNITTVINSLKQIIEATTKIGLPSQKDIKQICENNIEKQKDLLVEIFDKNAQKDTDRTDLKGSIDLHTKGEKNLGELLAKPTSEQSIQKQKNKKNILEILNLDENSFEIIENDDPTITDKTLLFQISPFRKKGSTVKPKIIQKCLHQLSTLFEKNKKISKNHIANIYNNVIDNKEVEIITEDDKKAEEKRKKEEFRTPNQKIQYDSTINNGVIITNGSVGTGKTYIACKAAADLLAKREITKIVISRATKGPEELGYLPGGIDEKMAPWMVPIYDELTKTLANGDKAKGKKLLEKYLANDTIEIVPLTYIRGRTFDDTITIVDEAQNLTENEIDAFITRTGENARIALVGDPEQADINDSGLNVVTQDIEADPECKKDGLVITRYTNEDITRSKVVKTYMKARARAKELRAANNTKISSSVTREHNTTTATANSTEIIITKEQLMESFNKAILSLTGESLDNVKEPSNKNTVIKLVSDLKR